MMTAADNQPEHAPRYIIINCRLFPSLACYAVHAYCHMQSIATRSESENDAQA